MNVDLFMSEIDRNVFNFMLEVKVAQGELPRWGDIEIRISQSAILLEYKRANGDYYYVTLEEDGANLKASPMSINLIQRIDPFTL